jgi:hypothetical protein
MVGRSVRISRIQIDAGAVLSVRSFGSFDDKLLNGSSFGQKICRQGLVDGLHIIDVAVDNNP